MAFWDDMSELGIRPLDGPTASIDYFPKDQMEANDGLLEVMGKSLVHSFLSVGKGFAGTAERVFEKYGISEPGGFAEEARLKIAAEQKRWETTADTAAEWVGKAVAETLPYMGATFVAGLFGGVPAAMGVGFMVEGQQAYEDAIARGASEDVANKERAVIGGINALIEGLQIGRLVKFTKVGKHTFKAFKNAVVDKAWKAAAREGGKLVTGALSNSIEETLEEFAQEGVSIYVPYIWEGKQALPLKPDGSINYVATLSRMAEAGLGAAVASPFLGLGKVAVTGMASPSDAKVNEVRASILKDSRLTAQQKGQRLHALNRLGITKIAPARPSEVGKSTRKTQKPKRETIYPSSMTRDQYYEKYGIYKVKGRFNLDVSSEELTAQQKEVLQEHEDAIRADLKSGALSQKEALKLHEKAYPNIQQWDEFKEAKKKPSPNKDIREKNQKNRIKMDVTPKGKLVQPDLPEFEGKTEEEAQEMLKKYPKVIRDRMERERSMLRLSPAVRHVTEINNFYNFLENLSDAVDSWETQLKPKKGKKGKAVEGKRKLETPLAESYTPEQINDLFTVVKNAPEYKRQKDKEIAAKALGNLLRKGNLPTLAQIRHLEPVLGKYICNQLRRVNMEIHTKKESFLKKLGKGTLELINVPKAIKASVDFSANLRQGFFMLFTDPKAWFEGVTAGYRAFADPDFANFMDVVIATHPLHQLGVDNGLYKSEVGKLTQTEEYFANSLAGKIPGVKASERAYVTALNVMRFQCFYHVAENWIGKGKNVKDYKNLATILNHLTGRGDIKALKDYMPLLNVLFFSPSFTMGRLQLVSDILPRAGETMGYNPARRIMAAGLVEAVGTGLMILMLLKYLKPKGVEVELDPRSTDFGKIKIGDTRVDFWAGYSQIVRLVVGMAFGQRKTTGTGEIIPADRLDIALRFLQTKLSPVAGLAVDLKRKQDFKGDIIELDAEGITNQTVERLVPLFLQDVADVIKYQGLGGTAALTSGLALHGVGVMTYPETESTKLQKLKNHYSMITHGEKWDNLSPITQKMLKVHYPLIDEQEHRVFEEQLHKPIKTRHMEEIRKSERQLVNSFPEDVQVELRRLLVDVGGLSRKISSDWYLNDERYKAYQDGVKEKLNYWVPKLLHLNLSPTLKRQYIEATISQLKKEVRDKIVFEATVNDIRKGRI